MKSYECQALYICFICCSNQFSEWSYLGLVVHALRPISWNVSFKLFIFFTLLCVWWPGLLFSAPHLVFCFVGLSFARARLYCWCCWLLLCLIWWHATKNDILIETLNENRTYIDRLFREWYYMIWIDWVFPNLVVCTFDRISRQWSLAN